jgi:hypothetical protein
VQKSDEPGILYRVTDNNSLQPAAEPDVEPSDADEEFGTEYPAFNELMKSICEFVVEWTRQKLAPRDERISKLEAKIETLTALLGQRPGAPGKSADVIDLLDWRKRTDVA